MSCGVQRVFAVSILVFEILRCTYAFVLPLPIEVGTDVEFDLSITLPYTVIFPQVFGRKKRSENDRDPVPNPTLNLPCQVIAAKMQSIFLAVGVTQEACQDRLLCNVHSVPDKYSPLSDVILQHIDLNLDIPASESKDDLSARYTSLRTAALAGIYGHSGECLRITPQCTEDPDSVLNWRLFNFLKILKTYFGIKFN